MAHPDDETIWMGGKILREKNYSWTIVSLCRKNDPDRKPKFFRVCRELNAKAFISDLDDDHPEQKLKNLDEVIKRLEPITHDKKFDFVFTHGKNGEYGHNRHVETHKAVLKMIKEDLLCTESVYTFNYLRQEKPFKCTPNLNSEIIFELSDKEFEKKKYLIHNVYGFDVKSFEFLSCSKKETFNKVL